jgi:LacI family transcriptional regulator
MKRTKDPSLRKTVTLVDVARECGLSVSSVSLVLNEKPLANLLSEKTRAAVRAAAQRLGYTPNRNAQALRSQRSSTIGVVVFDIADPFCTFILNGIQTALEPTGMLPIIMDATNQGKQFERYLALMVERRVEGLIVVANWLLADKNITGNLESLGIPVVVVGREVKSTTVSSVVVDNEAGGFLALEHLYQAGHRKIAVIRGPKGLQDSYRRWQGTKRYAKSVRYRLEPDLVVEMPDAADPLSGFDGGYEATASLLAANKTFAAVLAFDDLTALGAIRALHERGLRVPDEVSVIGFDDIPAASLTSPSLSTIRQDMKGMGIMAAQHVMAMIETDAPSDLGASVRLTAPVVVARGSTSPNKLCRVAPGKK